MKGGKIDCSKGLAFRGHPGRQSIQTTHGAQGCLLSLYADSCLHFLSLSSQIKRHVFETTFRDTQPFRPHDAFSGLAPFRRMRTIQLAKQMIKASQTDAASSRVEVTGGSAVSNGSRLLGTLLGTAFRSRSSGYRVARYGQMTSWIRSNS